MRLILWEPDTTQLLKRCRESLFREEEDAREERSGGGGGRDEKKSPRDQLQADRSVDTREECKTKWLPETDTDDSSYFFSSKEESSSVTTFDAEKGRKMWRRWSLEEETRTTFSDATHVFVEVEHTFFFLSMSFFWSLCDYNSLCTVYSVNRIKEHGKKVYSCRWKIDRTLFVSW